MWAAERVEQKKRRREARSSAARAALIGRVGGSGTEEGRGWGGVGVGRRKRIFPQSSAEVFLERAGLSFGPNRAMNIQTGGPMLSARLYAADDGNQRWPTGVLACVRLSSSGP